jgi:hypothetical protein
MAKSTTITKVKTPVTGELQWVTITGEGKENLSGKMQYVATVAFDPKEPAWAKLMTEVDSFWADNRPKKIKDPKSTGFYPEMRKTAETDEDGEAIKEATGRMLLAFKTGVAWPDGSPTIVKTYNSKGKEVALGQTKIGNGSIGSIAGAYDIYVNSTKQGQVVDAGITFYLNAIQIIKLVEFTDDAGFDAVDDDGEGWTGDEGWEGEGVEEKEAPKAGPRL